ncbi:P44 outermembrane protein, silent [Anaplasma phagocytophilum]|uniref:p44 outermembrane protein, silent n=1 Tax=Anaplasma phagocytophilum TaxID=948 RepID=A0A098GM23_ANAPH|nr:P44 outermembrane protein, silent [Anaplasma phagocytophilum]
MMLLIVRLISLLLLLLGTKVKTLLSLPRLLVFLTLRLIRRFVMGRTCRGRRMRSKMQPWLAMGTTA